MKSLDVLLRALAQSSEPLSETHLFAQAQLTVHVGRQSLARLMQHDVVAISDGVYDFTVPLMRRWIRLNRKA